MKISCQKHIYLIVFILSFFVLFPVKKGLTQSKDASRLSVIVIDPGHGGKDPGTVGGNVEEKNVVLDIALKLGEQIQKEFPDIKVVYTRKTDVFIPLHKRAEIANKSNADLFISIHANAVEQSYVYGTETFVLGQHRSQDNLEVAKKENSVILLEDDYTNTYEGFDPNSSESYIMFELVQDEYKEQSISLANIVQNEFRERAMRKDRSVKEAGFLVLRRTTMPGVLIETGFLSNSSERNYLSSPGGRANIASAIFRAFKTYKTDVEQKSSFHLVTSDVKPQPVPRPVAESKKQAAPAIETKPNTVKKDLYYSIQIAALKKKLNPAAENFEGLTNVFRVDAPPLSRYFSGKYENRSTAEAELSAVQKKYPAAFVVAFHNNQLISVKMAQELEK
ncbi:N-acetylmuramoyl-L-alanine amidase [Maribellus sp. YY47]|uniref:N-acetylmuramoyl-L-alanine amidase family protein n=1 Tax=Maribellus sp. YY47 TaxID=2929486 RepID=UPI002000C617|nr:N-acetylmuramoyl-L-alanine amidase [Maribellus sp. YY47]MCK3686396.1 N-acetylmuramoyl-L-alanine amidase [Maribellus sp. YY47]